MNFDLNSIPFVGDETIGDNEAVQLEFRGEFVLSSAGRYEFYITADQYYILYLDGQILGRKREFDTIANYAADFFRVSMAAGEHCFRILVWTCGEHTAVSVDSLGAGLYFASPHAELTALPWQMRRLHDTVFHPHYIVPNGWTGVAAPQTTDFNRIRPGAWQEATPLRQRRYHLIPGGIPAAREESLPLTGTVVFAASFAEYHAQVRFVEHDAKLATDFAALLTDGRPLVVPRGERMRFLVYFDQYRCGYWQLGLRGGKNAEVKVACAESLFCADYGMDKGHRAEVFDKYFRGITDTFLLEGNEHALMPHFWRCGNFLELVVENGAIEELVLFRMGWENSLYHVQQEAGCRCDDDRLNRLMPVCFHTFQMIAHDSFYDCPYYEQLPYTGDGRIELLTAYSISSDNIIPHKMLYMFNESTKVNGLCQCRTPTPQMPRYIPSFSLWFVGMVYDHARWKKDPAFIRTMLPQIRSTLEYFLSICRRNDGVYIMTDEYWNFLDWVPEWGEIGGWWGMPPRQNNLNVALNYLLAYALCMAAELEDYYGDPELAAGYRDSRATLAARLETFFVREAGLYADDGTLRSFSEHAQLLAILSGVLSADREAKLFAAMTSGQNPVAVGSVFFSHYFFEVCRKFSRMDLFMQRLQPYFRCLEEGFRTIPETFRDSRSDCHGWGALPLYHMCASVAGIRPGGFEFDTVEIAPQPDHLQWLTAQCPHSTGMISVYCRRRDDEWQVQTTLPTGLYGTFRLGREEIPLAGGFRDFTVKIPATEGIADVS